MKTHLVLAAATLLLIPAANAQSTVNWQPIQSISGDSDVYAPPGSDSVYAYYFTASGSNSPSVVNGVTFQPFGVTTDTSGGAQVGSVALWSSWNLQSEGSVAPANVTPFSNLSTAYQNVLNGIVFSRQPISLTLNDLTGGQTYLFQYWLNYSSGVISPWYDTYINTGTNNPYLTANIPGTDGGLGQYIVGSFTVGEGQTSFSLTLDTYDNFAAVTAVQVRTIPEPGTGVLLGLGALAAVAAIRRCRRTLLTFA